MRLLCELISLNIIRTLVFMGENLSKPLVVVLGTSQATAGVRIDRVLSLVQEDEVLFPVTLLVLALPVIKLLGKKTSFMIQQKKLFKLQCNYSLLFQ